MKTAISRAIRAKGLTQEEVAQALGVTRQAVTGWAAGKSPSLDNLKRLAEILDCSVAVLTGEQPLEEYRIKEINSPQDAGLIRVPVLAAEASCGTGFANDGNSDAIVGAIDFEPAFLHSLPGLTATGKLHIVHATGDSMEPTIPARSICLIDGNQSTIRGDGIYCLVVDGEAFIKRIQKNLDRTLTLLSDNPRYPPQKISREDLESVVVQGRVVYVLKGLVL